MPDFTVIDGGGTGRSPEDHYVRPAKEALRMLAVEVLRAMVRGDDAEGRFGRRLVKFNDNLGKSTASLHDIIDETVATLHSHLNPKRDKSSLSIHIDQIVRASLRVAAEQCCEDNAAAGRRSGREQELFSAIESFNRWRDRPARR